MEKAVTVIIPAYNEEKNIVHIIESIKKENNVEEIIVVDNNSTDKTNELAKKAEVTVAFCEKQGKGYAMKEGLKIATNDIIAFVDADINDYEKGFIDKMVAPIKNNNIDFVKTSFDREGGRVTELVVKPLLNIVMPNIYKFSQPLSGMIASKKELLEQIKFENDYGVDIGILLDAINLNAKIEEVHIGKIKNASHDWKNLTDMSQQVMQAIIKRTGI